MGVYEDMAHDAGYRGEEAKQMARAIEQDHMRRCMSHEEQEPEPDQRAMTEPTDADIIMLAEAIGWKWDTSPNSFAPGMGRWWFNGMCKDWTTKEQLSFYFDPRTNANHDYTVLEWIRTCDAQFQHDFQCAIANLTTDKWFQAHPWNYKVGFNARAAIAVLKPTEIIIRSECEHVLVTPADNKHIQWGDYKVCIECRSIISPDGSIFMQGAIPEQKQECHD